MFVDEDSILATLPKENYIYFVVAHYKIKIYFFFLTQHWLHLGAKSCLHVFLMKESYMAQ